MERPDRWVFVRYDDVDATLYAVLAGWSGGYMYGDSWKRSSPIVKIEEEFGGWVATSASGNQYFLNSWGVGLTSFTASIAHQLRTNPQFKGEILDTDEAVKEVIKEFRV